LRELSRDLEKYLLVLKIGYDKGNYNNFPTICYNIRSYLDEMKNLKHDINFNNNFTICIFEFFTILFKNNNINNNIFIDFEKSMDPLYLAIMSGIYLS